MKKKVTNKAIDSLSHCSREQLEEILRDALLEIYRLTVIIKKLEAKMETKVKKIVDQLKELSIDQIYEVLFQVREQIRKRTIQKVDQDNA
jgi:SHS2 domain-containing protein